PAGIGGRGTGLVRRSGPLLRVAWAGAVAVSARESERLHASVLVAPATERRRLRKQRQRAAATLRVEQHRGEQAAARAKADAERIERRATTYLPAPGEPGAAALRTPGRFRLPRH